MDEEASLLCDAHKVETAEEEDGGDVVVVLLLSLSPLLPPALWQ